jgi:hypothetical protein
MNKKDYLLSVLNICDRHVERLEWAMTEMNKWLPISPEQFKKFRPEDIAVLEVFSNRFVKLQDVMGTKLFPLTLEISQEPGDFPAFIDKLNRLEKIGAIPSSAQWLGFRQLRNAFAHDYPDDSEQTCATLNLAYSQAIQLLVVLKQSRDFALQRVM